MIHLVFQPGDKEVLLQAIALDESLQGDIFEIKDDYAVGPIADNFSEAGWQLRKAFWQEVLAYSPYTEQLSIVDDRMTVHQLKQRLDADEIVWIWMAQNSHDICGYYWLISQLKNYQGKVYVLYLNNLPFINEKGGLFYPTYLHEIQPKEFLKAKKLARVITLSEFEIDPDEWDKIAASNAMIRILEGGKKIVNQEIDFFDKDIMLPLLSGAGTQKLSKWIQLVLNKMKIKTGDAFLIWRLRQLSAAGTVEITGDWQKGWKDISVHTVATTLSVTNNE